MPFMKSTLLASLSSLRKRTAPTRWLLFGRYGNVLIRVRHRVAIDDLKTLCFFIGHGRTGSTLVGALINAHKNAVLSNEINALTLLRKGLKGQKLYDLLHFASHRWSRQGARGGGGYAYDVPNQYQGTHQRLDVIGDRKAGGTAAEVLKYPDILDKLAAVAHPPVRWVLVTRNPYNAISTHFKKTVERNDYPDSSAEDILQIRIEDYFWRCGAVCAVRERFGIDAVHVTYLEELIDAPRTELERLCSFLGLEPDREYLDACASIVQTTPRKTTDGVPWSSKSIAMVRKQMEAFDWLAGDRYSFA